MPSTQKVVPYSEASSIEASPFSTGFPLCEDLLLKITEYLSGKDFIVSTAVCRYWKNTIYRSKQLEERCASTGKHTGDHDCVKTVRKFVEEKIFTKQIEAVMAEHYSPEKWIWSKYGKLQYGTGGVILGGGCLAGVGFGIAGLGGILYGIASGMGAGMAGAAGASAGGGAAASSGVSMLPSFAMAAGGGGGAALNGTGYHRIKSVTRKLHSYKQMPQHLLHRLDLIESRSKSKAIVKYLKKHNVLLEERIVPTGNRSARQTAFKRLEDDFSLNKIQIGKILFLLDFLSKEGDST